MKSLISLFMFFALSGCNSSDFTSSSAADKKERQPQERAPDDGEDDSVETSIDTEDKISTKSDKVDENEPGLSDSSSSSSGGDIEISEEERQVLRQKCWFAVSGTWIGHTGYIKQYAVTFPETTSGHKIAHGEGFDSVGGVFLEARKEPYRYGEGGKEIDAAIDYTFDSIAVAPGMTVEIRDEAGNTLFKGDGPVIGGSAYYENQAYYRGKYYAVLAKRTDLPQWMSDYLKTNTEIKTITLQAGRYVKVSTVPGTDCAKLGG